MALFSSNSLSVTLSKALQSGVFTGLCVMAVNSLPSPAVSLQAETSAPMMSVVSDVSVPSELEKLLTFFMFAHPAREPMAQRKTIHEMERVRCMTAPAFAVALWIRAISIRSGKFGPVDTLYGYSKLRQST